jgi:hypothetical protein
MALVLPNLREVDLSSVQTMGNVVEPICRSCPDLARITWTVSSGLNMDGDDFGDAGEFS